MNYPAVATYRLLALLTGVGVQALIALYTVRVLLPQDILFPKQGLLTVVTVVALRHRSSFRQMREREVMRSTYSAPFPPQYHTHEIR